MESESSSSTASTTQNIDKRVVGGDASVNVSGDGTHVTTIDAGAVGQSFGFARAALKDAIDFAIGSASRQQAVLVDAIEGVRESNEQLADAYETAKAGEQKVLVGVAVAIVAVVAVTALRKAH